MKCPCGQAAELIQATRDLPCVYQGESTTIPAVTGDFCPACGEVILNPKHGERYRKAMGIFQRQVNAACVWLGSIAPDAQETRPGPAPGG